MTRTKRYGGRSVNNVYEARDILLNTKQWLLTSAMMDPCVALTVKSVTVVSTSYLTSAEKTE